jgi:hypothetical protein
VAALTAAAALDGPCVSTSYGTSALLGAGASGGSLRLEGLIWSARPRSGASTTVAPGAPIAVAALKKLQAATDTELSVRVTQKVVDQVNRQGASAEQIAIQGTTAAKLTGLLTLRVVESAYLLVKGDTHAFWRSHQTPATLPSFEELFGLLADEPDKPLVGQLASATGIPPPEL